MKARRFWWVVVLMLVASASWSQQAGLKIVVIEGEDAVNILMQNTAVQPIVEVRDRNNLPVAGALVTFLIRDGKAATFANNAKSLAVTTDTTGRAAANGMQVIGKGTLRIQAQASFQGQTASTTISQSNFATVADAAKAGKSVGNQSSNASQGTSGAGAGNAAAAGAAAAGGATAGAVAGSTGGGIAGLGTAATAGIVGGATVGGIVAVKAATGGTSSPAAPDCTAQLNQFTTAVTNEAAACTITSSLAQCTAAEQNILNTLGSMCTCLGSAGGAGLSSAEKQEIQQELAFLSSAGFNTSGVSNCFK